MKIAFDHHSPYFLAHGGFQIQIERTLEALINSGVEVYRLKWWDDSCTPDIIHFFGKPNGYYLEFAKNKGIRTVVSELHGGTGSHPAWKLKVQEIVIGRTLELSRGLARRMGWDSYRLADAAIALTPFEADLMCRVFHAPCRRVHVVPNGVEEVFLSEDRVEREDWLVFTGTITERKRAVEIAEAATIARVPLRMYGRPYSDTDPYYLKFLRAVEASGGMVRFCGEVTDRAELASKYRAARGLVLPSTMESFSLTALEAAATGCPLLVTDLPWARSTLAGHASYLPNTSDPATLAGGLKTFFRNPMPPTGYQVLSWKDVALQLKKLYESL